MLIPWDETETVFLLEAYLQVQNGTLSSKSAAVLVSEQVHTLAEKRNVAHEKNFRSVAGISMCLQRIAYLLTDGKHGLSNNNAVYLRVIDMWEHEPEQYQLILSHAQAQIHTNFD